MDIKSRLIKEFGLKSFQVDNVIALIDEGKTIPFIARYRKEQTGEMTDEQLREFDERLKYLRSLESRKDSVRNSITEQEKMTLEIENALEKAETLTEVEDIYEPFKKKKRTRATIAIEKGLEPLANIILMGEEVFVKAALNYVNPEKEVESPEEAITGAMDIIAQIIAEDFELKKEIRAMVSELTVMETSLKKGAEDKEDSSTYKMYFEYSEIASKMPPHRVLAVNRGENQDVLKVKLNHPMERIQEKVEKFYIRTDLHRGIMNLIIEDSLKRLMLPALERELRTEMTEAAEERAISVFGQNLKKLLLQPPLPNEVILGWDPAFRTGCKIAVIDETGKFLDFETIYPTAPQNKVSESKAIVKTLVKKHGITVIAIGNGTASRESELIVSELIKELKVESIDVKYLIVSEAGASVYSASKLGTEEFPDINVSIRGAISIGRRVTDPLAELVKIEPQHIGVGQYQHDVNQTRLKEVLKGVVEDAVNSVGIDLNTASYSLLSYVSGINSTIAKNIVAYREENGSFTTRKQLLKVARLGNAAYEQCAGFLRIKDGKEPLDNTAVHPESYDKVKELLKLVALDMKDLLSGDRFARETIDKLNITDTAKLLNIGVPTLRDIVNELKKPGRDIREGTGEIILRSDVLDIEDLREGMELRGTVRNVVDFGAFVDIGLKNDGLVHISELSNSYIKNPMDVVAVGDIVEVRVIGIDLARKKVSLSMKK
ncbi:MAG: Tex family protein [Filifactoraceae bacterium]